MGELAQMNMLVMQAFLSQRLSSLMEQIKKKKRKEPPKDKEVHKKDNSPDREVAVSTSSPFLCLQEHQC